MSGSNFTNLTCEQVRDYLDSYVCDELRVETYHGIQRHFDSCAACCAELAAMQRVRQLVQRAVQQETASDLLRTRIQSDLRANQANPFFWIKNQT